MFLTYFMAVLTIIGWLLLLLDLFFPYLSNRLELLVLVCYMSLSTKLDFMDADEQF